MKYIESEHQISLIGWAKNPFILKKYPELELLYANHNTQRLTPAQAGRWSKLGGRAGIPDLFLPLPKKGYNNIYHGLFIEMKNPLIKNVKSGGLTIIQKNTIDKLRNNGYKVEVCYGYQEAVNMLEEYLKLESI